MKDQESLLEAIDHYELLTPSRRFVFKNLIKLSGNKNVATISIKKLSEISKVGRPTVYETIKILESHGIIQRQIIPGSGKRLSSFILNPAALVNIINLYTLQEKILHE
jgi:Fe2+ or Zn2+ uptake regulation protein